MARLRPGVTSRKTTFRVFERIGGSCRNLDVMSTQPRNDSIPEWTRGDRLRKARSLTSQRCPLRQTKQWRSLTAMPTTTPDLLTVRQAAHALGLSPRSVLHRITTGTLAATKIGDGRTSRLNERNNHELSTRQQRLPRISRSGP